MKKANLVLLALLASNAFVKPASRRDWCVENFGTVAGAAVVGLLVCTHRIAYARGEDAQKEAEKENSRAEDSIKTLLQEWTNLKNDTNTVTKARVEEIFTELRGMRKFEKKSEKQKLASELEKIFAELKANTETKEESAD